MVHALHGGTAGEVLVGNTDMHGSMGMEAQKCKHTHTDNVSRAFFAYLALFPLHHVILWTPQCEAQGCDDLERGRAASYSPAEGR